MFVVKNTNADRDSYFGGCGQYMKKLGGTGAYHTSIERAELFHSRKGADIFISTMRDSWDRARAFSTQDNIYNMSDASRPNFEVVEVNIVEVGDDS